MQAVEAMAEGEPGKQEASKFTPTNKPDWQLSGSSSASCPYAYEENKGQENQIYPEIHLSGPPFSSLTQNLKVLEVGMSAL